MFKNCPFCMVSEGVLESNSSAICIRDKFPVTPHHSLVIPKRHVDSFFELNEREMFDCLHLINVIKSQLCDLDDSISGFNIGINDGIDAGQTIPHCHIHLIPRRKNDVTLPMGGIRHIIPDKGYYEKHSLHYS